MAQTSGQIENTPLWADVRKILSAPRPNSGMVYRMLVHTVAEDFAVQQIKIWHETRDYGGNIAASHIIEFTLGAGDYKYHLYPYRANLEVTLKAIPLDMNGVEVETEADVQRFKAIFRAEHNATVQPGQDGQVDANTLNQAGITDVVLEIQDRVLEPLRRKMAEKIWRDITPEKLLRGLMVGVSRDLVIDGVPAIDGIDLVPPDNQDPQRELVIDQGVLLSNLPTWLQEKGTGVYNAGIGSFFQRYNKKNLWFVYPLYRFNRFDEGNKRLVIYCVPNGKLNGVDRTWKVEGDVLKILCVGNLSLSDDATVSELNKGFGFRMADAKAMMAKPVKIKDGQAIFSRTELMTEVGYRARGDGLNYAPHVAASGNVFHEYSKVVSTHATKVQLTWENANPSLLYPGMPTMVCFMDGEKYVEQKGCLAGADIIRALEGRLGTGRTYSTHAGLGLLLDGYQGLQELPTQMPAGTF